jgi:hypothetical protein
MKVRYFREKKAVARPELAGTEGVVEKAKGRRESGAGAGG